ncbi:MAG: hypothetical protein LBV12_00100, partial [Puniceicoccales bacterium]|nr:hypothetical protein [Puniceicoccales bacterium]
MSKLPLSLLVASASVLSTSALFGAFTPNDPYYTTSAATYGQWHLRGTSDLTPYYGSAIVALNPWLTNVKGNNVTGAWALGYTGKGVVIGV